jgi:hypothetical protein
MSGEEVRDARRLISGRSKDACAHRPVFGFTDEQGGEQQRKVSKTSTRINGRKFSSN